MARTPFPGFGDGWGFGGFVNFRILTLTLRSLFLAARGERRAEFFTPKALGASSPRLAPQGLPWERAARSNNRNAVAANDAREEAGRNRVAVRSGTD